MPTENRHGVIANNLPLLLWLVGVMSLGGWLTVRFFQ